MGAAIGTIPYFSTYQPGALPIASTVYIEIVDSLNATTAQSWNQSQIDFVGKAPSVMTYQTPIATDQVAFYQPATGLPKMCRIGDFGLTVGNLPAGGATGTFLSKVSGTSYAATWTSTVNGPFGVIGTATITGSFRLNGIETTGTREKLFAERTYYVRTTGSDSNNGLTVGAPFATLQKAIDVYTQTLDVNSYRIIINLGSGAWSGGPYNINPPVGGLEVVVQGQGRALTSVSLAARQTVQLTGDSLSFDGSLGNGNGLEVGEHAEFGGGNDVGFISAGATFDIYCYDYGAASFFANYYISGNKSAHFHGDNYGRYHVFPGIAIGFVGTPVLSSIFDLQDHMCVVLESGVTCSGTATGLQYTITGPRASIRGDVSVLPGSTGVYYAGIFTDTSDYLNISNIDGDPFDGIQIGGSDPNNYYTNGGHNFYTRSGPVLSAFTLDLQYGTATLTAALGIIGTTLVTGTLGIVGTSNLTGLLNVVGGISSPSPTGGIGYGLGSGSATTQTVSKATGVTLNTVSGQITTHSASLAGGASVFFIVTNSNVGLSDVPFLAVQAAATSANYRATPARIVTGSFGVVLSNLSTGALTDAVVLNFVLFKGVAA